MHFFSKSNGIRISQYLLGLFSGIVTIILWIIWTYWDRAPLAAIGMGVVIALCIAFSFPKIITAMIACFILSAPTQLYSTPLSLGLLLVLGVLIIRKLIARDYTWRITPFIIWCSLFFLWKVTTIIWKSDYDFISFGFHINAFLIMIVFSEIIRDENDLHLMIYASGIGIVITFGSIIVGLLNLYMGGEVNQMAESGTHLEKMRFYGFWDNSNALAYSLMPFLALSVGMLFSHEKSLWKRIISIVAAVAGIISILVSLTRGALLCTILIMVILVFRTSHRWLIITSIAAAFVLTTIIFPTDVFSRFSDLNSGGTDSSINERSLFLIGGIEMIDDSFPFGFGAGTFLSRQTDYVVHRISAIGTHNSYVSTVIDTGLIGILLLIGTFYSLFITTRQSAYGIDETSSQKSIRITYFATLLAVVIAMAFEDVIGFPAYWLFFTLLSVRPLVTDYREPTSHMIAKQL